jgi:hypothetical protein
VVVSELRSALDALGAEDLTTSFGGPLLDRLAPLLQAHNQLSAEIARTVRECELTQAPERDGLKSMQSWLIGHGLLSKGDAERFVRAGRVGERMPAVAAAASEGSVTAAKVVEIGRKLTPARLAAAVEQGHDMAEVDGAMAMVAATQTHEKLAEFVASYVAGVDPDGPEPDPTEGRRFWMSRGEHGWDFGGHLDPVAGEKVATAVESIAQADRPKGDDRTRSQQNADALVQLAENQLASGNLPVLRTVKPHVVVTIDVEDLVDPSTGTEAARTGFGATLSAARARGVACDSTVTRIVLGPDGLPLDVGRTHRVVPPHLRRAVENRDRHCVFAGCGAPTHWCDVHHLVEWINDGETSLDNSALLCERHHTKVHHGFRVQRDDGAPPGHRWRTWRPDGTEILIGPLLT